VKIHLIVDVDERVVSGMHDRADRAIRVHEQDAPRCRGTQTVRRWHSTKMKHKNPLYVEIHLGVFDFYSLNYTLDSHTYSHTLFNFHDIYSVSYLSLD